MYKTYHDTIKFSTPKEGFISIRDKVEEVVATSGITDGTCVIYCPHTTGGITVNENYDPDVAKDLIFAMNKTFPDYIEFKHMEGNSAAHIKASVMGCQETLIVLKNELLLGRWQGVYFTEFDGPRTRSVKIMVQGI